MRSSGLLCLMFKGFELLSAFPLQTCQQTVQLQHELRHERLAHILEVLFQSLIVGSSKRLCLAPANKHVPWPIYVPIIVSVRFLCEVV